MSTRNVANEILSILDLVNVGLPIESPKRTSIDEVRQFIAGFQTEVGAAATDLTFPVSPTECVVIVCIEQFNADTADPLRPQKMTIGSEGITATRAPVPSAWALGGDVFYVFGPGGGKINIQATPAAGTSFFARLLGYYLPIRCLERLSRIGTKIISTSDL